MNLLRALFLAALVALLPLMATAQTSLAPAQLLTLKAAINAETDPAVVAARAAGDNGTIANFFNGNSAAAAWRTDAPVNDLLDAITWSNYTPNDAVGAADTDPTLSRKIGWLLTVQTKQMNLQLMLQGRDRINCAPPNVRAGIRDATIQLPTGAGGAATSPGGASGATVLARCTRIATRAELALAAASQGSDTTGATTARVLTWQGRLTSDDVREALAAN